MELQLDQNIEHYKPFLGRNTEQMHLLIAEDRMPISVSGLESRKFEVLKFYNYFSENVRNSWLNYYFDTGDGIALHPNGKVKIVPDALQLRQMNEQSPLRNGALILTEQEWKDLEGLELTRKEADKYFKNSFTEAKVNENPVHLALARDKNILKEYSHEAFAFMKQKFNYNEGLGLYKRDSAESVPTMRLWMVRRLESRSDVNGRCDLGNNYGLLVGVRQGIAEGDLQKIIAPTLDQIVNATKQFVPEFAQKEYEQALSKLYIK